MLDGLLDGLVLSPQQLTFEGGFAIGEQLSLDCDYFPSTMF